MTEPYVEAEVMRRSLCRAQGTRQPRRPAMRRKEGDDEAGGDADESERDADEVVARAILDCVPMYISRNGEARRSAVQA